MPRTFRQVMSELAKVFTDSSAKSAELTGQKGENVRMTWIEDETGALKQDLTTVRMLYDGDNATAGLGSFIARPIINSLAGYIGIPKLMPKSNNYREEAQAILDDFITRNRLACLDLITTCLRDGKSYGVLDTDEVDKQVPYYGNSEKPKLTLRVYERDNVTLFKNAISGTLTEARLKTRHTFADKAGNILTATIITRITPAKIEHSSEDATLDQLGIPAQEENLLGFIPIVEFVNEPTLGGRSEIKGIVQLMDKYSDTMKHALIGNKLHAIPRLKLWLKNRQSFLRMLGYSDADIAQGKPLVLTGKELLTFTSKVEEDAQFIEPANAVGASLDLLKLLYYCMIVQSETPEFVLGVHMSSSYASTKEQAPVFLNKVNRKQSQFTSAYAMLARMVMAALKEDMDTYETEVVWITPDTRDMLEKAQQQVAVTNAVVTAVNSQLMSERSAIETLKNEAFSSMKAYQSEGGGEVKDIEETAKNRSSRDAELEAAMQTLTFSNTLAKVIEGSSK